MVLLDTDPTKLITAGRPSCLKNTPCSLTNLQLNVQCLQRINSASPQGFGLKTLILESPWRSYFSETQVSVCFTSILKTADSLDLGTLKSLRRYPKAQTPPLLLSTRLCMALPTQLTALSHFCQYLEDVVVRDICSSPLYHILCMKIHEWHYPQVLAPE